MSDRKIEGLCDLKFETTMTLDKGAASVLYESLEGVAKEAKLEVEWEGTPCVVLAYHTIPIELIDKSDSHEDTECFLEVYGGALTLEILRKWSCPFCNRTMPDPKNYGCNVRCPCGALWTSIAMPEGEDNHWRFVKMKDSYDEWEAEWLQ